MTETEKRVPDLRFKGFIEDWEQRKLGNLSEITDTKHATAPVVDSETPYKMIRTSAVRDGRLFPDRMDYVTYDTYEQWSERIHLKQNDVVISREAPMGEAAVIPTDNNKYFLGQRMVGIRVFDDLDPFFLLSTFLAPKFRKEIQIRNAESTTVANFGIPSIKGYEVDIPKKEEQTKIGSFFRQLDNTIALHQRKLTLLKQLKEAYLQLMFPQIGENSPALRFAGFSEPWEQRKLNDLYEKGGSGGTPQSTNKSYYMGDIPFLGISDISASNGYIYDTEKHISEKGLNNSSAWIVPKEAISLAMYASVGKVAILKTEAATSQAFYNMVFKKISTRNFIFQYLLKIESTNGWNRLISTGTQANLNAQKVRDLEIMIPSLEEQDKIGTFFNRIDHTIDLHQKKISHIQDLKKALLQKMFI